MNIIEDYKLINSLTLINFSKLFSYLLRTDSKSYSTTSSALSLIMILCYHDFLNAL